MFAFVLLTKNIFGGAERRFTNLHRYLCEKYRNNFYFFVSYDLYYRIIKLYKDYPVNNLIPIGKRKDYSEKNSSNPPNKSYTINQIKNNLFILRKLFKFLKNYKLQYQLFKEIDHYRKKYNIKAFIGVYSGIIPLYFYLKKRNRDVGIIFTDMDSWFSNIYSDIKKYWYKKYSSFNYGLENSDFIDFLSPFILKGIQERGIKIPIERISITPCSFTDYSVCKVGKKDKFQVAFSSRLEQGKNPLLFLEAAIEISKKYTDITFHIMGEGRLSNKIQELINSSGIHNIKYHGFHPNPTKILADTSVFVSIQSTNNYPSQSVLEAMACGNAIIASDVGDTRMFVNEENGILINLNKYDLINAIEKLYLDRSYCKKLGENASKYARQYHTIERVVEYYIALFQKAIR